MNIFKAYTLACCLTLASQGLFAEEMQKNHSHESTSCDFQDCNLGTVGFVTMDPANWYQISVPAYPDTVLLSHHANMGSDEGAVTLRPSGLTIYESGNYSVTASAFLINNPLNSDAVVPVFVVKNENFNPNKLPLLIDVISLPSGGFGSAHISGILTNVKAGTRLTIVASSGGNPNLLPISVGAWTISAFKIPCE